MKANVSEAIRKEETESERNAKAKDVLADITSTEGLEVKLAALRKDMLKAAADLEFEQAATLRDQIKKLEKILMDLPG